MSILQNVQKSFSIFVSTNELGNSDIKKLNQVLEKLNVKAEISKENVIRIIAPKSKDPDANYRNFISRIKNAVVDAIENSEDEYMKSILESITIDSLKANSKEDTRLSFSAVMPKTLSDTVRENPNYEKENYVDSQGSSKDILKYFISYATKDARDANLLKERLLELTEDDDTFIQWNMIDLQIGEDFDVRIKKELKECNYGIALVSEHFLKSDYIMNIELEEFLNERKLIPVGLTGSIESLLQIKSHDNADRLFANQIFTLNDRGREDFFTDCTTKEAQESFVKNLIEKIKYKAEYDKKNPTLLERKQDSILECTRQSEYNLKDHIPQKGESLYLQNNVEKFNKDECAVINEDSEEIFITNTIDVQQDLYAWVFNRPEPLYAILGDYGMGKTFNCRIFAKKLHDENLDDSTKPAVVYIDLRDVPTFIEDHGKTRQPYVHEIIEEVLRLSGNDSYTPQEIIEKNKQGEIVIIFDGLDEKLVHYTKDMQSKFLGELLHIIVIPKDSEKDEKKKTKGTLVNKKQKVLLSCRSHYFENISKQNSFLTGHGRSGLGDRHYKSINILPLDMESIRMLISKLLSQKESEKLMEFIENEKYLKGVASRPFMLNKLTSILPSLIKLKGKSRVLNTKTFYQALIEDTFDRDNEKHTINIRHKKELLMALSMELYNRGEQKLNVDELNDWFAEFVMEHPKFKPYLIKEDSLEILERDLRNSTLLVRFGDSDFGFSHSSIYEYFLSEYIISHWELLGENINFSLLTEQFVFEGVALLTDKENKLFIGKVAKTLYEGISNLVKFALQVSTRLDERLDHVRLKNINLESFVFESLEIKTLEIDNSNLHGSTFKHCKIEELLLNKSNIGNSFFENATVANIKYTDSILNSITSYESTLKMNDEESLEIHDFNKNRKYKNFEAFEVGHHSLIRKLNYHPNGKYLASSSYDKTIKIWDEKGNCVKTLIGHDGLILSLIYSPDGKYIVSASYDKTIKIWDKKGNCIKTLRGHGDTVTELSYSLDGKYLASGSHDHTIKIWDNKGECIKTLVGHSGSVNTLAYCSTGKYLATGSDDKSIKIWNIKNECIKTLTGHKGGINVLSYSHDGKYLTSGSNDNTIKIWDEDGKCIKTLIGHNDTVVGLSYSPNGKYLASASFDATIRIWNNKGDCIKTLTGHDNLILSICYRPDGKYLASSSLDGSIKIWDEEYCCTETIVGSFNKVGACCYSLDGKYLASGSHDHTIKIWDDKGECIKTLIGHSGSVNTLTYSSTGKYLATGSDDKSIRIWNLKGECIKVLTGHEQSIHTLCYSPDELYLISYSSDNTIKIWNDEGECMKTLAGYDDNSMYMITYSHDGKYIASCADDNGIMIRSNQGKRIRILTEHEKAVYTLQYHPKSEYLASGSADNSIKIWDEQGTCIKTLIGHTDTVLRLCYTSTGKYLASASYDNTIKIWNDEGECIKTLIINNNSINSLEYSPDSENLVITSNNMIKIFNVEDETIYKIFISNEKEWSSFDMKNKKIKGTPQSWKFSTLAYKHDYFRVDDFEGYEVMPYEE